MRNIESEGMRCGMLTSITKDGFWDEGRMGAGSGDWKGWGNEDEKQEILTQVLRLGGDVAG